MHVAPQFMLGGIDDPPSFRLWVGLNDSLSTGHGCVMLRVLQHAGTCRTRPLEGAELGFSKPPRVEQACVVRDTELSAAIATDK